MKDPSKIGIIDLEKETRKLAAKLKSQEAKRNYNKFYIRTAPVEIDLRFFWIKMTYQSSI